MTSLCFLLSCDDTYDGQETELKMRFEWKDKKKSKLSHLWADISDFGSLSAAAVFNCARKWCFFLFHFLFIFCPAAWSLMLTSLPASILAPACHSRSLGSGLMTANEEQVCSSLAGAADVLEPHLAAKVTHPLSFILLMRQKLELLLDVFFFFFLRFSFLFFILLPLISPECRDCVKNFPQHAHWFLGIFPI